ncbi:phosphate ABC transporter substrate-binding protein PstS [Gluconobacter frateurii]|uniref:Phosphate-binding protein PstS n=1 Tax=Gluconobacter frateurii NRIC 0228 TaxID=1307946 RepID=A0ABQ0QBM4_9PROT|nr:phosphate ABC transporter substrate-binding protein PstS [Gluconobacter frateurii]OAG72415.1 phosphate-binding periplasmic protein [Gluconobacter japonicus]UMM09416.1 phosphate ABC transporter substrate-binding protein PstS [Gluconobacter frateurii]GBR12154.1 phosphate-binding periplasmic protein [Gluconobacter frateurii NRIC 0228]GLP89350.1 phosphate-binding protein PstS [Gluconobacter frateurii]
MIKSKLALFGFVAMTALGSVSLSSARAADITGAGSSFAAPIYGAWGEGAKHQAGINVNYQSVGSSAGQDQVVARTVDFGASDKPMAAARLASEHLYQFPTVMSGIVVVVNVPGIEPGTLRLDGPTLAALYDGEITEWDDDRIKALNPGLKLPETDVAPVHRADGSGTSFVFTSYLSQVSPEWKQKLGAGTSVAWPGGSGARGNDGIAAMVKQTEGGIGYVEYSYAAQNHLNIAQMKNHTGAFVSPTLKSFVEAANAADWAHADHYAVNLLDTAGPGAWPIVTATFVLVPTNPKDATTAKAVRDFFAWGFQHGDADNTRLDYVGLPQNVKDAVLAGWGK